MRVPGRSPVGAPRAAAALPGVPEDRAARRGVSRQRIAHAIAVRSERLGHRQPGLDGRDPQPPPRSSGP